MADSNSADEPKDKKEQAKRIVDNLISAIKQTVQEEEAEMSFCQDIGRVVLLKMGAIEIEGRLTFII